MEAVEVWKEIPGYNKRYFASNLGRVKNKQGKILKPQLGTGGYLYITIAKAPNKFKRCRLHRIIALTFIANPDNLPQINHINENKQDNSVSNLEWCTGSYNMNYGHRKEKFFNSNKNCKTLSKEVCQYTLDGNLVNIFPSMKEAARSIDSTNAHIISSRIGQCCRKLYKKGNSSYGYLWEYRQESIESKIPKIALRGIPIIQYDLQGNVIKVWDRIIDAIISLNLPKNACSNISRSAKSDGKIKAYGYIWKYDK